MNSSVRGGLAGVGAAAAALGVAELIAVGTGPNSAPLLAVGGVVIDTVPAPVKDFGVAVFGVHDKTALLTGTAILLVGYAFVAGVVAARRWWAGVAMVSAFGVVGVAAAVTRHDAGVVAALPSLVAAVVAVVVLRGLLAVSAGVPLARALVPAGGAAAGSDAAGDGASGVGTSPRAGGGGGDSEVVSRGSAGRRPGGAGVAVGGGGEAYPEEGRRRFLKGLGVVVGVSALGGVVGRLLTGRRAVSQARNDVVLPAARQSAPVVPAGVQAPGATAYVTGNDNFYRIDTALYPPQVDPATWQLRIHGMVRNPITVSWADLLRRPMVERYVTLTCVSNEVGDTLVGNALWLGTPIRELLEEAGPLAEADQVVQRSVDGWTCGSPTAVLRDGRDALLAVGMNGKPLPVEHGFPVRMVVPGLYGYVSACKWITEIELTRFADFDAYWVPRGWSAQGPIKTQSRIDTPRAGGTRAAGAVTVAGVAWAQHKGIAKVEVQVDDEPWRVATLAATVSADTWRQWSYVWNAAPGKHRIRVRATDTTGYTQTSTPAPPAPDGATGWHAIDVTIE
ncbi:molybdopterin-dependent oxidoreductase [Actinoplanes sp. NPDC049265]|uniref:molybdopterin-dependent oxidoreductase n=1 Tax=Actinoplanes sp. NPDC049265 TaxID=3363902 RepID=UPI00371B10AB